MSLGLEKSVKGKVQKLLNFQHYVESASNATACCTSREGVFNLSRITGSINGFWFPTYFTNTESIELNT
jgi:hypothetical protein